MDVGGAHGGVSERAPGWSHSGSPTLFSLTGLILKLSLLHREHEQTHT